MKVGSALSIARIKIVWYYVKAYIMVSLVWCGWNKNLGLQGSFNLPLSLAVICGQHRITAATYQMALEGFWQDAQNEMEQLGITDFTMTLGGRTRRMHRKPQRAPRKRGIPVFQWDRQVAARIGMMRIQTNLLEKQLAYVREATGMSRMGLLIERILWYPAIRGFKVKGLSPQGIGVIVRILNVITFTQPFSILPKKKTADAMLYIAGLERGRCCWISWSEERIEKEWNVIADAVMALRDSIMLAVHQLHCKSIRNRWVDRDGRVLGESTTITGDIGHPFAYLGERYQATYNLGRGFTTCFYTLEMLGELTQMIQEHRLQKGFVLSCIKYGIFLIPQDHLELSRVVGEEGMKQDGIRKAAWLYHHNVPVRDMAPCVALMPYTETFAQARSLAQKGVLPELLEELQAASLLPLRTDLIAYIHEQCQANDPEKIYALLCGGLAPEYLRTGIHLWGQFPDKTPQEIGTVIQRASTLKHAKLILQDGKQEETLSKAKPHQTVPRKRKRIDAGLPLVEEETARVIQQSRDGAFKSRVPVSWLPASPRYKELERSVRKQGWRRVRAKASSHQIFEKGGRTLMLSASAGGYSRYSLARDLTRAGFTEKEVSTLFPQ
ncbi:MAG: hypothetical protein AAB524_00040 [Patescibacteria group bacterium]